MARHLAHDFDTATRVRNWVSSSGGTANLLANSMADKANSVDRGSALIASIIATPVGGTTDRLVIAPSTGVSPEQVWVPLHVLEFDSRQWGGL